MSLLPLCQLLFIFYFASHRHPRTCRCCWRRRAACATRWTTPKKTRLWTPPPYVSRSPKTMQVRCIFINQFRNIDGIQIYQSAFSRFKLKCSRRDGLQMDHTPRFVPENCPRLGWLTSILNMFFCVVYVTKFIVDNSYWMIWWTQDDDALFTKLC